MFESLCYAQMPPEICLGWFALKARGQSQDGCASACACGVDLSSGIKPGIRSLSTAKLRTTLPFRVRLSKGTTVHRIPTLCRWGRAGEVKKSKTKQNQEEEKKNTFLPLYFHFPQHFIYTHDAVLEKQKGRHREQQPSEVRARRVAG